MSDAKAYSSFDRTPPLREMADRESLRELCEQIGTLLDVGIALYDETGAALVPPPAVPAYCARRCASRPGADASAEDAPVEAPGDKERCDSTKINVALPLADELREKRGCFTGFQYLALSIRSGLDPVGVAVLGPFREVGVEPAVDPPEGLEASEREALEALRGSVRAFDPADLERTARYVTNTIELFLFSSLKNYLASKVHLESVNESFRELQAKNRELRASYEKLKQLDHLKSNFLATVSHELRTPLTSIIGYGEMALDGIGGKVPPGARKHVAMIVQKGEQLLQLINSVLDMSKIESGRMDLTVERIRVKELVTDALGSVRPQAKKKNLRIVSSFPENLPELLADRYKLRQVLVNLLSNAVKFTPVDGRIRITASRKGRRADARVKISVSDSGVGIPADQHARVFERFYQVDNSSTRQYGGTGLGLPIVRSFIEMHGGTIEVESEPGKGTTMTIELPLSPPARPAAKAP